MNFNMLNPYVRDAITYERIDRTEERVAYDSRIIYVISGDVAATVDGKKLSHLKSGNLLYIPAGVSYKIKGQYLRMAVITFDLVDRWAGEELPHPVAPDSFDRSIAHIVEGAAPFDKVALLDDMTSEEQAIRNMCEISVGAEGEYRAVLSAMLKLLLIRVAEAADESALPVRMVEALGRYIRENVGEEISNTEVGAIFGYHPFYISKVIKAAKGETLKQYIISYRLKLAKRMLEAGSGSIAEIAEECGFTDASYFTKTFRLTFGMTPKEYRNKFKEEFI